MAKQLRGLDPGRRKAAEDDRAHKVCVESLRLYTTEMVAVTVDGRRDRINVGCIYREINARLRSIEALGAIRADALDRVLREALGEGELYPLCVLWQEGLRQTHQVDVATGGSMTLFRGAMLTQAEYAHFRSSAERVILLPAFTSFSRSQAAACAFPQLRADPSQLQMEVLFELETRDRPPVDGRSPFDEQEVLLHPFSAMEVRTVGRSMLCDAAGRTRMVISLRDITLTRVSEAVVGSRDWVRMRAEQLEKEMVNLALERRSLAEKLAEERGAKEGLVRDLEEARRNHEGLEGDLAEARQALQDTQIVFAAARSKLTDVSIAERRAQAALARETKVCGDLRTQLQREREARERFAAEHAGCGEALRQVREELEQCRAALSSAESALQKERELRDELEQCRAALSSAESALQSEREQKDALAREHAGCAETARRLRRHAHARAEQAAADRERAEQVAEEHQRCGEALASLEAKLRKETDLRARLEVRHSGCREMARDLRRQVAAERARAEEIAAQHQNCGEALQSLESQLRREKEAKEALAAEHGKCQRAQQSLDARLRAEMQAREGIAAEHQKCGEALRQVREELEQCRAALSAAESGLQNEREQREELEQCRAALSSAESALQNERELREGLTREHAATARRLRRQAAGDRARAEQLAAEHERCGEALRQVREELEQCRAALSAAESGLQNEREQKEVLAREHAGCAGNVRRVRRQAAAEIERCRGALAAMTREKEGLVAEVGRCNEIVLSLEAQLRAAREGRADREDAPREPRCTVGRIPAMMARHRRHRAAGDREELLAA